MVDIARTNTHFCLVKPLTLMKQILLLIFCAFQTTLKAQSDQIVITTLPEIGSSRFFGQEMYEPKYLANTDLIARTVTGIPAFLKDYRVAKFSFPAIFNNIVKEINAETNKTLRKKDSLLLKKGLKYFNMFVIGLHEGDKIIIVDTDNNYDFSNDYIYRFPLSNKAENLDQIITLNYESINDGKIVKRRMNVGIKPFNDKIIKLVPFPYDVWVFSFSDIHKGSFSIENKKYNLFFWTFDECLKCSNLIIKPMELELQSALRPAFSSSVLDTFKLGNKSYYFSYISKYLDTLVLKETISESTNGLEIIPGNMMPNLVYRDMLENPININEYRGKFLLIDIWGTWCGPCIAQMPKIKSLHEKYRHKNFAIIGIAFEIEKTRDKLKAFISQNQLNWKQVYTTEPMKDIFPKGSASFPTYILVAPDGRILERVGLDGLSAIESKLQNELK
jgi:thiol-disulfide isomerase/thioredoxin